MCLTNIQKWEDSLINITSPVVWDSSREGTYLFKNKNVIYDISENMCTPILTTLLRKNKEYDFGFCAAPFKYQMNPVTVPTSRSRSRFPDYWLLIEWFIPRTSLVILSLVHCFKVPCGWNFYFYFQWCTYKRTISSTSWWDDLFIIMCIIERKKNNIK